MVQQLRRALREKFPQAQAHDLSQDCHTHSSGEQVIPAAAISEAIGVGGQGLSQLLLAELLRSCSGSDDFPQIALVEGNDGFDPASFHGEVCSRVLWVRCSSALEMLKAAELLARDGNLGLIVVDAQSYLPRELRALPVAAWWRLKQTVEGSGVRLVVCSPFPLVPSAQVRFALSARLTLADFERPRSEVLRCLDMKWERMRYAAT